MLGSYACVGVPPTNARAHARAQIRAHAHACVHAQHRVDAKRSCNGGSPLRCAAAARHTSGLSLGAILGTGEVDEVERRDAEHIKARRGLVLTIISRFDRLLDGLSDSPIHSSQSPKRGSARGADDAPERTALAAPDSACGKKGHTECEVGMDGHSARAVTPDRACSRGFQSSGGTSCVTVTTSGSSPCRRSARRMLHVVCCMLYVAC